MSSRTRNILDRILFSKPNPWPCLAVCLLMIMMLVGPSWGQTDARQRTDAVNLEQLAPMPNVDLTLQRKTRQNVTTNTGRHFIINSQTLIVGPDGKELGIAGLPVPCEATVTYVTRGGERTARRINVTWVSANATAHMASDVPH